MGRSPLARRLRGSFQPVKWTLAAIEHLLDQGYSESDTFDFKEALPHSNDEAGKQRLAKACAAFANSAGGFLVFGVRDKTDSNGHVIAPEQRLVGVQANVDLLENFGNYPLKCTPSVVWKFRNPALPLSNGNLVHVIEILKGLNGPHAITDRDSPVFWKRTNKGDEPLTYEDLQSAFIGEQRKRGASQVLRSELAQVRQHAEQLRGGADVERYYYRFDIAALKAAISEVCSLLSMAESLLSALSEVMETGTRLNGMLNRAASGGDPAGGYGQQLTLQQLAQTNGFTLVEACRRSRKLRLWE
ncbi:MAG TPA: ATP-binding protein [Dehalococcoidia bacterium]|nr:ATP-binding protein [Dehalococcoidia bacterium]